MTKLIYLFDAAMKTALAAFALGDPASAAIAVEGPPPKKSLPLGHPHGTPGPGRVPPSGTHRNAVDGDDSPLEDP
jgi:hypothetical protein